MTIEFCEIQRSNTKKIAEIHCEELGEGVVSLFGSKFVQRLYVNLLEVGNWGFMAKDEGDVVGFVFATKVEVPLQKSLTFSSIIFFLLESIRSPVKFYSFLVAFKEFFLLRGEAKTRLTNTTIELSHFAVREYHKGIGIGGTLIAMLEERAREEGFLCVFTRTHNKRLSEHYVRTKNAKVVETISLGQHDSTILEWRL